MQIIQSQLGSQVNPLGLRSPLADSHRLLLRTADSSFLNPLVTPAPLVTASKFLLARKHKPFMDQLIDWNNQDGDSEFLGMEFDSFDGIPQEEDNYNNGEESKVNIPDILPTPHESYSSNDIAPELNISPKSTKSTKSKKTQSKSNTKLSSKTPTKSRAKSNTKSTSKSETKKSVKSSVTTKVEQVVDEISTPIHHEEGLLIPEQPLTPTPNLEIHRFPDNSLVLPNDNEDALLIPEQPLTIAPNSGIDRFEDNSLLLPNDVDVDLDNNVNNHPNDGDSLKTPLIETGQNSPIVAEESIAFRNYANDEPQVIPESPSILPSTESSTTVNAFDVPPSMTPLQPNPNLDSSTSDFAETSPIETTSPHVGETHTLLNNLANNEQPLLNEASLVVDVSDISVSPTSPPAEILTSQIPAIADNQSALIQKTEVNRPKETELFKANSSFESDTAIESDLISNITTNDAVIDNAGVDNYVDNLPLFLTNTSPILEDTSTLFRNLANDEQPVVSELPSILPSAESAKTVNATPVVIQPLVTATNSPESSEVTTTDSTEIQPTIADAISNQTEYPQHPETPPPTREALALDKGDVGLFDGEQSSEDEIISPANLELTTPESTGITPVMTEIISPEIPQVTTTDTTVVENAIAPTISPEIPQVTTTDATVVENAMPGLGVAIAPTISSENSQVIQPTIADVISNQTEYPQHLETPPPIREALALDKSEVGLFDGEQSSESEIISPANLELTTPEPTGITPVMTEIISPKIPQVTTTDAPVGENVMPGLGVAIAPTTSPEHSQVIQPTIADVISNQTEYLQHPETPPPTREALALDKGEVRLFDGEQSSESEIISPANLELTTPESTGITPVMTEIISPEIPQVTTTDAPVGENVMPGLGVAIAPTTSPEHSQVIQPTIADVISNSHDALQYPETPTPQSIWEGEPLALDKGGVGFFDDKMTSPETSSSDTLPAPQGYATGGQVTASSVENTPQIAPSDTVPAMLTPGEFVINAKDAQKNLHILRQINSGAAAENVILPSVETPNLQTKAEITSPETPTKVDTFSESSIQRQNYDIDPSGESNSFTPASLGVEIGKQRLSMFNSVQLNPVENTTTGVDKASPHYSSPTLIFRKPNSTTNTTTNTPAQWSNVEDLLYGNNDQFTSFNFGGVESNWQNSDASQVSQSSSAAPQIFTKRLTTPRGFADGGEVTAPDISRDIQPITETIQSPVAAEEEDHDHADLEVLAHEIYHRLRQRIEIERERHGISLGRLPW